MQRPRGALLSQPIAGRTALSFLVLGLIAQLASTVYLTVLMFTGGYLAAQFRCRRRSPPA